MPHRSLQLRRKLEIPFPRLPMLSADLCQGKLDQCLHLYRHLEVRFPSIRASSLRSLASVSCIYMSSYQRMMSQDSPCELLPLFNHVAKACLFHRFPRHLFCNLGLHIVRFMHVCWPHHQPGLSTLVIRQPSSVRQVPPLNFMLHSTRHVGETLCCSCTVARMRVVLSHWLNPGGHGSARIQVHCIKSSVRVP